MRKPPKRSISENLELALLTTVEYLVAKVGTGYEIWPDDPPLGSDLEERLAKTFNTTPKDHHILFRAVYWYVKDTSLLEVGPIPTYRTHKAHPWFRFHDWEKYTTDPIPTIPQGPAPRFTYRFTREVEKGTLIHAISQHYQSYLQANFPPPRE